MTTVCYRDDCTERVFPGMTTCDADHDQPQAAPFPPDAAIQRSVFDLLMHRRSIPVTIEGSARRADDLRAHIDAQLAGLHEAQRIITEYRAMKAAIAVLLGTKE